MATVIKFMLQVSPSYRPTCDQILSLPIIESLVKKFFPEDAAGSTAAQSDDNPQELLLKTIRLSKNIFSLTERLPKAKYRSPKAGSEMSGVMLLPGAGASKSKGTLGIAASQSGGDDKLLGKNRQTGKPKSKSRLQEYLDTQNQGGDNNGYEEEDGENERDENTINAHARAKALKQISIKGKGQHSDYEADE